MDFTFIVRKFEVLGHTVGIKLMASLSIGGIYCTPQKSNIDTKHGHISRESPFPNHHCRHPIGSMGREYLPLFMWPFFTFHVGNCSIHGSYGYVNIHCSNQTYQQQHPPLCPHVNSYRKKPHGFPQRTVIHTLLSFYHIQKPTTVVGQFF